MKKSLWTVSVGVFALGCLRFASAQEAAPKLIPFQGRLSDANGNAVTDGSKVVQFKIYNAPVGGQAVWNGEVQKLTANDGLVSTMLGTKASLSSVDFNVPLYLELTIDANNDGQISAADPPLLPRQSILPAIFAKESAQARDSSKLAGFDWSSILISGNDPTRSRIDGSHISLQPIFISGGSVGIGAANPSEKLHVAGNYLRVDGAAGEAAYMGGDGAANDVQFGSLNPTISTISFYNPGYGWFMNGEVNNLTAFGSILSYGSIVTYDSIVTSGRVGIGTASPKAALHVNGDYYGHGHLYLYAYQGDGQDGNAYVQARDDSGTSSIGMVLRTQRNGTIRDAIVMDPDGNVGIGTAYPSKRLEVHGAGDVEIGLSSDDSGRLWTIQSSGNGTPFLQQTFQIIDRTAQIARMIIYPNGRVDIPGSLYVSGVWIPSDQRFKKNAAPIANARETIARLQGVTFEWQPSSGHTNDSRGREIGFLAQEVQNVLPDAVKNDADGHLWVNYNAVTPVLVEALKEQQKQIDQLKAELASLKGVLEK
jgi:hypothetical protein